MSVFVEITSSLGRRLTVTVPAEEVEKAIQAKVRRYAKTHKIPGFRTGKDAPDIPLHVAQQHFGAIGRGEAIEDLLQSSLRKALEEEKLYPAEPPKVQNLKAEPGMALEYSVTFDVYPEVKLKPLTNVTLEKLIVPIEEPDVEQVLEQMRQQHIVWEIVQRPAQIGDQLTVDLQGKLNNETAPQLDDKNVQLVLDPATLPPDFMALMGASAGDVITIELNNGPGKQNALKILATVHSVAQPNLPALDAAFAQKLGVDDGDIAKLHGEVRKHMDQELEVFLRNELKEQVLDALLEQHQSLEIPKTTIEEEYHQLEQDIQARAKKENPKLARLQLPRAEREKLQEIARRRVILGIIFPAIVKEHNLTPDPERVKILVDRVMHSFEQAANMTQTLLHNKEFMARLESQALEDQVIDHLLSQVNFKEKTISYTQALALSKGETHDHSKRQGHKHHPSDAPAR